MGNYLQRMHAPPTLRKNGKENEAAQKRRHSITSISAKLSTSFLHLLSRYFSRKTCKGYWGNTPIGVKGIRNEIYPMFGLKNNFTNFNKIFVSSIGVFYVNKMTSRFSEASRTHD